MDATGYTEFAAEFLPRLAALHVRANNGQMGCGHLR